MIDIRLTGSADEDFLKASIEAAYHEYPRLIARGGATLERAVEDVFEGVAEGFSHVAVLDGQPVGAAWWLPDGPDTLTVAYFVAESARNQGIASKLLEAGLAESKARGMRSVTVKTHPENQASIALARKAGFDPVVALYRQSL